MADYPINDVERRVQFSGNTGLGPFAFTFNIEQNTDIVVYKNDTLLTLTTDYTVTINSGNGTGSVTLTGSGNGTALISSDLLTIVGGRALSRTTDFTTGGDLLANSLNEQLDANVIMAQQLDEKFKRALKQSQSDADGNMEIPSKDNRKGKVLAFNATSGNPEAGPNISDVSTLAAITADISTLADIEDGTDATDAIQTVAANSSNVTTVAGISANVTSVAGIASLITSDFVTDINLVATSDFISDINSLATSDFISDLNAIEAVKADVTTVAGSISNVSTVASSIADVNTFANVYRIGATDPTTSLDDGDLFYNTTSNNLKFYNGSAWTSLDVADEKSKVSSNDTTAGFLNGKLVASTNITLTENSDGGNETLGIAVNPGTTLVQKSSDTGAAYIPSGTTAQRDASPSAGYLRFNSTTGQAEIYTGSAWSAVGGGATGAGGDQVFVENDQSVDNDYTISTNRNAMSTGPITIASGVTVTVPSGSNWVVL
jgi:hypothetical protein